MKKIWKQKIDELDAILLDTPAGGIPRGFKNYIGSGMLWRGRSGRLGRERY